MKIILTVIFIVVSMFAISAYGEEVKKDSTAITVNESLYDKESVPVENTYACQVGYASACEVPVLLNKITKKIEYYWSGADSKWVIAGDQQAALQDLYNKREAIRTQRQLKAMQDEMDRRARESMEEGQHNTPNHK